MTTTITMSSKGQFTLPVALRKQMRIRQGDQLIVDFNASRQSLDMRKAMDGDVLSAYLTSKIQPAIKPLENIDEYYQKHRGEGIR